jgi:PAS domain S-box-containing protein
MTKPLKLLIVEDSEIDVQLLLFQLQDFGYRPAWDRVDDQPGLLAALKRSSWDIVLCDYTLPTYNGLDALATIRKTAPDLPVILVSGTIGEDVAVEAMRAGAYDYLLKDRLTRLGAAVQRSLQEAEQRRARRRMEDRLRLLFHAIETSPASIVITDTAGQIQYANPGFTQMTGYSLDDVRGKNPRFLKSGTMASAEYARLWRSLEAGEEWQGEFCNRTRDGQLVWESATISPVRDSMGASRISSKWPKTSRIASTPTKRIANWMLSCAGSENGIAWRIGRRHRSRLQQLSGQHRHQSPVGADRHRPRFADRRLPGPRCHVPVGKPRDLPGRC